MKLRRYYATVSTAFAFYRDGIEGGGAVDQNIITEEVSAETLQETWEAVHAYLELNGHNHPYQYYVEDLGIILGNYYEMATGDILDFEKIWDIPDEPFAHYMLSVKIFERTFRPVQEDNLYSLLHKE